MLQISTAELEKAHPWQTHILQKQLIPNERKPIAIF